MGRPPLIDDKRLLEAARDTFVKAGSSGSTRDIAKVLGISEAAIFKRYPTKAALFLAAMQPPRPDIEAILAAGRNGNTTEARYICMAEAALTYFRQAIPIMLPLMTHPDIGLDELLKHYGQNPTLDLTNAVARWLGENSETPNPMAAAALIISAMHSVAQFEIMGIHGGKLPPDVLEAMILSHWKGLGAKV